MSRLDDELSNELADLDRRARLRTNVPYSGPDRLHLTPAQSHSASLLSFCSNDYLGLATDARLANAASEAATRLGVGSSASRLVAGDSPLHHQLETGLASYLDQEATLLFPTGYQANIGAITALTGTGDHIVSDAANHASLIDGCRLSRATVTIYPHADVEAAQRALAKYPAARRTFLITESIFSMDGDRAPLVDLATACNESGANLIVDEAHALGALGPNGKGICAETGIRPAVTIGTLGKAFGTSGGFVAGSPAVINTLVNRARTYIYTTAPALPILAATLTALEIVSSTEGDRLRRRLADVANQVRSALQPSLPSAVSDHILPLIVGRDAAALAAALALKQHGILVPAIRPPTVPENAARLRITLSAAHQPDDINRLLTSLAALNITGGRPLP